MASPKASLGLPLFMSIFSCKVCAEKSERIQDLKAQIQFLQSQLGSSPTAEQSMTNMEADAVLSGLQHEVVIPTQVSDEQVIVDVLRERDRLLSGSY